MTWARTSTERPPATKDAALTWDPRGARMLLVVDDARADEGRTQVWALTADRWEKIVGGAFAAPDGETHYAGPPVAWSDPAGVSIGRFAQDGLHAAALEAPARVRVARGSFGPWVPEAFAVHHPRLGAPFVHVCSNDVSRSFAVKDGALVSLAEGPYVLALAYAPPLGVVGVDVESTLHVFDGESWRSLGSLDVGTEGLAWDPRRGALVTFVATDDERMELCTITGTSVRPVQPAIIAPAYRSGVRLAIGEDARVVCFGGQDFERAGGLSDRTFFTPADGGDVLLEDGDSSEPPPLSRYSTAITTADRLLLANHSRVEVCTLAPDGWARFASAPGGEDDEDEAHVSDDRMLNFTAWGERAWLLDAKGELFEAARGGAFERLGGGAPGPGGHYAHRVGMAWDEPGQRVVVFGAVDRNDTWVFDHAARRWVELRPETPPPHGIASLASSPEGVFAITRGELWRLVGDQWRCLDDRVPGTRALVDPSRELLLCAGDGGDDDALFAGDGGDDDALFAFSETGWRRVLDLPGIRIGGLITHRSELGIDPSADRVHVLSERASYCAPLAALDLPEGGWPRRFIDPPTSRRRTPPPEWTRRAARVVVDEGAASPPPGVAKAGHELLAILPAHPEAMRLPPGFAAIAVWIAVDWWADPSNELWRLGGKGIHAALLEAAPPLARIEDAPRAFHYELFDELDPEHVDEVDTLPANQADRAFATKIGGWPRYVQGDDPNEEWSGPPLRFVAQLAPDLYSFGDVGSVFVYLTEEDEPRALAVMQSH